MSTLLLRLKAPMQAWGIGSRFTVRATQSEPTKSGVLGLLAAAEGRRRTDPLEDLAGLAFGVRIDQPGRVMRDFQTAIDWRTHESKPLSTRYYLADAIFVAGIEAPEETVEHFLQTLGSPRYPLFLGRRSCPVGPDLVMGKVAEPLEQALRSATWQASEHHRRTRPVRVNLPIYRDSAAAEGGDMVQDVPLSFAQENRRYGWRKVHSTYTTIDNPDGTAGADPFLDAVRSS